MQAEPIGARLKRLRVERGLSQRELSSPGVSYAYISRIEAGARTPSVKALRMLAKKLGVSVEFLETGSDLRDSEERELRLSDAELRIRLDGDTREAEAQLRAIVAEAHEAGDQVAAARAATALGFAAAARGNHLDAVEQLEAALAEHRVPAHVRPDVYATLGQSYAALGAADRGVHLFERCLADVRVSAPDDTTLRIRYATLLSYALGDAGDHDRAASVVREALDEGGDDVDPHNRVRLLWSLARAAGMDGRSAEALHYIRRAIALLEATDDTLQLARGYLLSGGVEALEGRTAEAKDHVDRAERLLSSSTEPRDVGLLRIGQSRVAYLERDADTAVKRAREALDILGEFHAGEQGAACWALADGLTLAGDAEAAASAYARAVDVMVVHGRRHDAAQACERWAETLDRIGRQDEAESVRTRATELRRLTRAPAR